jgi:hypothetical protein
VAVYCEMKFHKDIKQKKTVSAVHISTLSERERLFGDAAKNDTDIAMFSWSRR